MQVQRNRQAERDLMQRVRDQRAHRPAGLHLSGLIHCARKTWAQLNVPELFSEESDEFTLITFLGKGHHTVLEPREEEAHEIAGLFFTPDELEVTGDMVVEFKTTRKSALHTVGKHINPVTKRENNTREPVPGWKLTNYVEQLAGYCAKLMVPHGRLHVFYLVGGYGDSPFPQHHCWDFHFEPEELQAWNRELVRRELLIRNAPTFESIPLGEHYAEKKEWGKKDERKDWECEYCPLFSTWCQGNGGERTPWFNNIQMLEEVA